jgi:hypothetical protein
MKLKHNGYSIRTYTVGQSFGTEAIVRRGGWSATTNTVPLGFDDAAVRAAIALADRHAARHAAK